MGTFLARLTTGLILQYDTDVDSNELSRKRENRCSNEDEDVHSTNGENSSGDYVASLCVISSMQLMYSEVLTMRWNGAVARN